MADQNTIDDLRAESEQIDQMVADLDDQAWQLPTPASGWTVADQVAHLAFIFKLAGTAASAPDVFAAMVQAAKNDFDGAVNAALTGYRALAPADLYASWQAERDAALAALAAVPAGEVVPWLVNPLPPGVLACAGMMESFAHGQDIADATGAHPERTDRIGRVVGFAVLTRDFGYQARGLTPPDTQFRFELTAPSGTRWEFGPADCDQRVTGPAVDFCLLVTRRRHRADLAVVASGSEADAWLDIAQAYRGPAGPGRAPGQFAALKR
jgi:uncharacterized protein (TIGR03084 family)